MQNWQSRLRGNTAGNPARGGSTDVKVSSILPAAAKLAGGVSATLTGSNFRKNADGTAPAVTIGGVAATGVAFVNATTLTLTVPASAIADVVDVVVTIDGHVGTLFDGFTYYTETLRSLSPASGPIAGGTVVTITGANFDPTLTYRILFGSTDATGVSVLDDKTVMCTTPNNAAGFFDVVAMNGSTVLSTIRNGFQYTLLVRGEDIRRNPGIQIFETLGAPPSTCSMRIDGAAPAPAAGEKIQVVDSSDSDRVLWAGTIQTIDQLYEDQTDQIAWDIKCVDFTMQANRKRPVGAWFQVSASQVVTEIFQQFCPGYTTRHVQTKLAKITLILDGSKDLITVLNDIAAMIGGGHWYVDFVQDLHFFHIVPASLAAIPVPPQGPPPVLGYITLADGGAAASLVSYIAGYISVRCQFIYSDGTIGALGMWSNLLRVDGTRAITLSNIPVGATVGTRTVVGRRLWYHRLGADRNDSIHAVYPFCDVNDNTTTTFTTLFGAVGATVVTVTAVDLGPNNPSTAPTVALGAAWPALSSHSSYLDYPLTFSYTFIKADGTESLPSPTSVLSTDDTTHGWDCTIAAGPVGVTKRRLYINEGGVSRWLEISDNTTTLIRNQSGTPTTLYTNVSWVLTAFTGATTGVSDPPSPADAPDGLNPSTPPGPATAPTATPSSAINGDPLVWVGSWQSYRYAYLYRDGSVSMTSPSSAPSGSLYMKQGYWTISARVDLTAGPNTATNVDCIARLIYSCLGVTSGDTRETKTTPPGFPIGYGDGIPAYLQKDPDWVQMVARGFNVVPDNTSDHAHYVQALLGTDAFYGASNNANGNLDYWSVVQPAGTDFVTPALAGKQVCIGEPTPNFSKNDSDFAFAADPVPTWPNNDGPDLESNLRPAIIDDNDPYLLHENSGSQPFRVTTDSSQVRNRINVIGAGSTLAANYVAGSVRVYVGDISAFALGGGRFRIVDPNGTSEFADYRTLQQDRGIPYVDLKTPLSYAYSMNSVVYNFYTADDLDSQKYMAKYELDAFGKPTDGIHEYTISDGSLKTTWQLFMRAHAELELFAKPIITVRYATRNPDARIGRLQEIDLTFPPCQGTFLIQQVMIDQIRDEGDQLAPRYTVSATSVRYDLNDLILRILGGDYSGSSSVSAGGQANAGASIALAGGSATGAFPKPREMWAHVIGSAASAPTFQGVGGNSTVAGTLNYDTTEIPPYQDNWRGPQRQSAWGTLVTATSVGSVSSALMTTNFIGFLEDQVDVWMEVKTPISLTGCILHVGGFNSFPAGIFGANIGFISLSYVQGTDSGWTVRMQTPTSGGNRTLAIPTSISLIASTIYTIRIQSSWDGADYRTVRATFTVNGTPFSVAYPATLVTGNSAMPTSGALVSNGFTALGWGAGVVNNLSGATCKLSIRRVYLTSSGA